ncbi:alpha/beta hydrolase family protein [Bifidobacterium bombi]|uniref:Putative alpha/beta hydrolase family n=1 Tax=Bifidobacterium bombi DSM 19703 TaxID=1341695 RepID=A0A086BP46_9BIFI|nr:acyl-CoA thioester hydrolase/BAAT C-terminal domain-containing protein [Bifidobacterium bombi]KFF30710.1 putative alpha/beta hydrolase family [Bifidobacterium bombi DSM 19703]
MAFVQSLKRSLTCLTTFIVLSFSLMAIGAAMMPHWTGSAPYKDHIRVASANTDTSAVGIRPTAEGTYEVHTTYTRIRLPGGTSVDAIIREPIGAPAHRPACLFVHGAGTGKASEVFGDIAPAMASAGIVTLVPSKRLDTYSTLRRDYFSMARDYEASLNVLRRQPGVDRAKTGIYSESEGTWISEVMAADDPSIAFMILTSPPAMAGRHQMAMAANTYLSLSGAPEGLHRTVDKILSLDFRPFGPNYADFPAERYLSHLTMPILANYGTDDPSMPIEQGAKLIIGQASKSGNVNVTVRYYDANHQMRVGAKTSKPGLPLDVNYTKNLEYWVHAVTSESAASATSSYSGWTSPQVSGSQPHQRFAAPTRTPSGIVGSLNVLAGTIGMAVLCFALAAVLATAGVMADSATPTRHRLPSGLAGILGANAGMMTFTLVAFFIYTTIAVTNALKLQSNPQILHAGWILLRILAFLDASAASWLAARLIFARRQPARAFGACRMAATTLTVAGVLVSLLSFAFFGLYNF